MGEHDKTSPITRVMAYNNTMIMAGERYEEAIASNNDARDHAVTAAWEIHQARMQKHETERTAMLSKVQQRFDDAARLIRADHDKAIAEIDGVHATHADTCITTFRAQLRDARERYLPDT